MLRRSLLAFVLLMIAVGAAAAQPEHTSLALETGVGFTSGPTTFLLTTELPVRIAPNWDLGPLVQLGFGDDRIILAPTLNVRYSFPLSRLVRDERPLWDRVRPTSSSRCFPDFHRLSVRMRR